MSEKVSAIGILRINLKSIKMKTVECTIWYRLPLNQIGYVVPHENKGGAFVGISASA